MAKNIMISNEVYGKLRSIKESNPEMSYSDTILSMEPKKKTFANLIKAIEKMKMPKDDKEYDKIMKDLKKGWARWTKRYA